VTGAILIVEGDPVSEHVQVLSQENVRKREEKFATKSRPKLSKTIDQTFFTRLTDRLDLADERVEQLEKRNQKLENMLEKQQQLILTLLQRLEPKLELELDPFKAVLAQPSPQ
jgi:predicted RNase H-like nuclease (RuvC/YqgF family)